LPSRAPQRNRLGWDSENWGKVTKSGRGSIFEREDPHSVELRADDGLVALFRLFAEDARGNRQGDALPIECGCQMDCYLSPRAGPVGVGLVTAAPVGAPPEEFRPSAPGVPSCTPPPPATGAPPEEPRPSAPGVPCSTAGALDDFFFFLACFWGGGFVPSSAAYADKVANANIAATIAGMILRIDIS